MTRIRVKTGVSGLSGDVSRRANDINWHVFCDDDYLYFGNGNTLREICEMHPNWTLTGLTGNGVCFTRRGDAFASRLIRVS